MGATVLRSRPLKGKQVRTHAKFFAIDHRTLVITSANFSKSAEFHNVELGLRIDDPALTASIESQMQNLEQYIYEVVRRT
ncbi:phospholipase D-like domain-containing protein [Janibacter hoylei]|uniref:phospholipase D-like domain-containing protein n=1 Tax=Janibacter hoylei TaxID=364298 RepID=UPI00030480FE